MGSDGESWRYQLDLDTQHDELARHAAVAVRGGEG